MMLVADADRARQLVSKRRAYPIGRAPTFWKMLTPCVQAYFMGWAQITMHHLYQELKQRRSREKKLKALSLMSRDEMVDAAINEAGVLPGVAASMKMSELNGKFDNSLFGEFSVGKSK